MIEGPAGLSGVRRRCAEDLGLFGLNPLKCNALRLYCLVWGEGSHSPRNRVARPLPRSDLATSHRAILEQGMLRAAIAMVRAGDVPKGAWMRIAGPYGETGTLDEDALWQALRNAFEK